MDLSRRFQYHFYAFSFLQHVIGRSSPSVNLGIIFNRIRRAAQEHWKDPTMALSGHTVLEGCFAHISVSVCCTTTKIAYMILFHDI